MFCTCDIITHLPTFIKNETKKPTFDDTPSYRWFAVLKLPPEYITIHYQGHIEWIEKVANLETQAMLGIFETASKAAAAKVKTYRHPLQAQTSPLKSCSPIDASESFANKILRTNFKFTSLKNLHVYGTSS